MKKSVFLLALTVLASCAPLQRTAVLMTADSTGLSVVNTTGSELHGDPSRPGNGAGLVIDGTADYTPDAKGLKVCQPTPRPGRYACNLPAIPAGTTLHIGTAAGTVLAAQGLAYAGLGTLPVPLVLLK